MLLQVNLPIMYEVFIRLFACKAGRAGDADRQVSHAPSIGKPLPSVGCWSWQCFQR